MKHLRSYLLVFTCLGVIHGQASDRPLPWSLEELMSTPVISATRSAVSLREAPASVTVITRDDIQRYGWRTLADALDGLAGFQTYSDRIYDFVACRGFALPNDPNSRILLLVNGHSMVEPFGYYNGHLPSPDLSQVERIEVARGPNSVTYGTNALFAIINVITKRGSEWSEDGRVYGEAGSFQHEKLTAGFEKRLGDEAGLFLQGSFDRGGDHALYFPEYDNPAYGTGGNSVPSANVEKTGDLSLSLTAGHWSLQALYNDRKKNVPTGLYGGRFDTDQTYFRDTNYFIELGHSTRLSDQMEIKSRAYLDGYEFRGRYLYYPDPTSTLGPPYGSEFNRIKDQAYGAEVMLTEDWSDQNRTVFGLEGKRYGNVAFDYYSEDDPDHTLSQSFDRNPHEQIWSCYAMHQYTPTRDWFFQTGLHFDRYDSVGGHLSFRGSLGYQVFPRSWLKLLYGEAFRAPNQWELHGGFFLEGNPSLKPEVVRTGEILLDMTVTPFLNLRQSLYAYEDRDTIQAVGGVSFGNGGGIRGTGLESEARFVKGDISAFGSVSYADVRRKVDDLRLELASPWLVKAGFSRSFLDADHGFTLGAEIRAVGPRIKSVRSEGVLPSYKVANLTLSGIRIGRWFELSASVYNLLDAKYDHPSFAGDLASWNMNSLYKVYEIPADGRSFIVRATFRH